MIWLDERKWVMATVSKIHECVKEMQNIPFELKQNQIKCLELLSSGKDVLAVLPTGYGKSIIYAILPKVWDFLEEIRTNSIVIVISPLVSLMKDQVQNIGKYGIDSVYLGESHNSGTSIIVYI